jgi:hypothetical protein
MRRIGYWPLALLLILGCSTSSLTNMAAQSLMGQMGGMGSMSSLAGNVLKSSVGDSRLSGLMGGLDMKAVQPTLSNQLCSMLGGGCAAPLSESQIAAGAEKLTPTQADAVKENFGTSLGGMSLSSSLQSAVSSAISPKLPGIIGALL